MLKTLEKTDLQRIFAWRNAPNVRRAMFSDREISWEEHLAWFQSTKSDESNKWFVYSCENNEPSGVVYFKNIDSNQSTAFWGFYAAINASPGTGMRMSIDALNKAFNELSLERVNAEVLVTNSKSLNFHLKVGFIEEGCFTKKRLDFTRLRILASEWPACRKVLESQIAEFGWIVKER